MATIKEVARELGITEARVSQLIGDLGLKPERYGRSYILTEEDIEALKNRRRRGRPKKTSLWDKMRGKR